MPKKLSKEEFINRSNIIHNNRYDYSLVDYKHSKTKVKIICPFHGVFEQIPNSHLLGIGCSKCSNRQLSDKMIKSKDQFILDVKKVHNDKYDYTLVEYSGNKTKVKIICPLHGVFEQKPNNHLTGYGCNICGGTNKSNTLQFINKSQKIHDNKYNYSLTDYKDANIKVKIICPTHGIFEQQPYLHLQNQGCPICNQPKGEKIINRLLKEYNINFETQKTFDKCKNKRNLKFDFYLPDYNICIEYDGEQHYKSIKYFGGEKGFSIIQKRDKIKNDFCKNHNIRLIRIKYNENIDNILNLINI